MRKNCIQRPLEQGPGKAHGDPSRAPILNVGSGTGSICGPFPSFAWRRFAGTPEARSEDRSGSFPVLRRPTESCPAHSHPNRTSQEHPVSTLPTPCLMPFSGQRYPETPGEGSQAPGSSGKAPASWFVDTVLRFQVPMFSCLSSYLSLCSESG